MKSNSVTIQIKPLQQYFHMVLFILWDLELRLRDLILFVGEFFLWPVKKWMVISYGMFILKSQLTNLLALSITTVEVK